MNTNDELSSGYITEFNRNTGIGLIQEDTTKQIFPIHFNSFKGRSKRYLKTDSQYIGELFVFNIIVKQQGEDGPAGMVEAVNIRHFVLKCNVEGCPRIKAFTNVKALEEHMKIRHTPKEKKEETSELSSFVAEKSKKEHRPRPKPILISLSSHATPSTIGRFIGKQGVNLKRFQQQNRVKIQLLDSEKASNSVQIRITPHARVTIDIKSVSEKLKSEWKRCVCAEQLSMEIRKERSISQRASTRQIIPEFESDSRYKDNSKFSYIRRLKQEVLLRKRKCRQSEPSVRVSERHSSLNQEGHRSTATCASEYKQKSIFNYTHPKSAKKTMKEAQWLVNEQLQDLK